MTHVLIVEDHEENRNLLKMLLEANGYRVTAVGNGLEALAAARRDRPAAIVSDVLMPKMDGFALCRAWMQDVGLRTIPFIFYSATYVRPEDEQFAMALGAVRYLLKPLEAKVFLAELREVLRHWAGQAAPVPAAPLDDLNAHALHESALARKVEDKMAQLEAVNSRLRQSEEKFRNIFENLPDVYVEASADGTILEIGSQVATLSKGQYGREDLLGTSTALLFADPQYAGALLLAMKDAGRAIDMDAMFRNRDGSLIPCSVSATKVRGADGSLTTVFVLRDISTRKQAERDLAHAESRFRGLAEQWCEGLFVVQDQALVYCNPKFVQILGYSSDAGLIGRDPMSICVESDLTATAGALRRMLEPGAGPVSHAFAAMRKDGSIVGLELKGVRALYDDRPAIIAMIRAR